LDVEAAMRNTTQDKTRQEQEERNATTGGGGAKKTSNRLDSTVFKNVLYHSDSNKILLHLKVVIDQMYH
jgi:hypothetical protein